MMMNSEARKGSRRAVEWEDGLRGGYHHVREESICV
jgi:hypothetical protein